ncbi:MAG: hypothetical protein Q4A58_07705 [Fusobacterium sp.]|uniref:hypothetical protein n=1 Tax=Fusobacterium sp. TaxID=68766 RepID=UPI0026DAD4BA|nr:hypothetical protein [Fusobacterium sp.]MDO4691162.1 hypothetical protein [Fusobacterium sp.]
MDNMRIKENENKLVIKKGWITKKIIILYFIIVAILLLIYVNSPLSNNEFEKKYPYIIFFIRISLVLMYWLHMNKKIRANFILESICIHLVEKKIILQTHRKNEILSFKQIKNINIRDIKNIDAEKNAKEKYALEFITNKDSSEYLWGFALSETKAQEIKEKLLKIFSEEGNYEVS